MKKSFCEFYSQIKEDIMDANTAMQAPTVQNVRPAPVIGNRLAPQAPAAGQAPAGQQQQTAPAGQQQQTGNDPNEEEKLKAMLGKNYENFVVALGDNIKDPKFLNFLQSGLKDGKDKSDDVVSFAEISPKCSDLLPTQNEIDLAGSLGFPLKKESTETLTGYLNGGTHCPGKGCPNIIVCGKHIIDGHHRWSQLYCMNPNAQIKAINLIHPELNEKNPTNALKVVQMAIGAKLGYIPTVSVSGTNLIGISESILRDYIKKTISKEAINAFSLFQKENPNKQESNFDFILKYLKRYDEYLDQDGKIADYSSTGGNIDAADARAKAAVRSGSNLGGQEYNDSFVIEFAHNHIWKNVQLMNARNKPISGASKRDFMPQTDPPATGWDKSLAAGEVNWKQECLILSGLLMRD